MKTSYIYAIDIDRENFNAIVRRGPNYDMTIRVYKNITPSSYRRILRCILPSGDDLPPLYYIRLGRAYTNLYKSRIYPTCSICKTPLHTVSEFTQGRCSRHIQISLGKGNPYTEIE